MHKTTTLSPTDPSGVMQLPDAAAAKAKEEQAIGVLRGAILRHHRDLSFRLEALFRIACSHGHDLLRQRLSLDGWRAFFTGLQLTTSTSFDLFDQFATIGWAGGSAVIVEGATDDDSENDDVMAVPRPKTPPPAQTQRATANAVAAAAVASVDPTQKRKKTAPLDSSAPTPAGAKAIPPATPNLALLSPVERERAEKRAVARQAAAAVVNKENDDLEKRSGTVKLLRLGAELLDSLFTRACGHSDAADAVAAAGPPEKAGRPIVKVPVPVLQLPNAGRDSSSDDDDGTATAAVVKAMARENRAKRETLAQYVVPPGGASTDFHGFLFVLFDVLRHIVPYDAQPSLFGSYHPWAALLRAVFIDGFGASYIELQQPETVVDHALPQQAVGLLSGGTYGDMLLDAFLWTSRATDFPTLAGQSLKIACEPIVIGDSTVEYDQVAELFRHTDLHSAMHNNETMYRTFEQYDTRSSRDAAVVDFNGFRLFIMDIACGLFASERGLPTPQAKVWHLLEMHFAKHFPPRPGPGMLALLTPEHLQGPVNPITVEQVKPAKACRNSEVWAFGNNFAVRPSVGGMRCPLYARIGGVVAFGLCMSPTLGSFILPALPETSDTKIDVVVTVSDEADLPDGRTAFDVSINHSTVYPVYVSNDRLTWSKGTDATIVYEHEAAEFELSKAFIEGVLRPVFHAFGRKRPDFESEDGVWVTGATHLFLENWSQVCQRFPKIGVYDDGDVVSMIHRHPVFFSVAAAHIDSDAPTQRCLTFTELIQLLFHLFVPRHGVNSLTSQLIEDAFENADEIVAEKIGKPKQRPSDNTTLRTLRPVSQDMPLRCANCGQSPLVATADNVFKNDTAAQDQEDEALRKQKQKEFTSAREKLTILLQTMQQSVPEAPEGTPRATKAELDTVDPDEVRTLPLKVQLEYVTRLFSEVVEHEDDVRHTERMQSDTTVMRMKQTGNFLTSQALALQQTMEGVYEAMDRSMEAMTETQQYCVEERRLRAQGSIAASDTVWAMIGQLFSAVHESMEKVKSLTHSYSTQGGSPKRPADDLSTAAFDAEVEAARAKAFKDRIVDAALFMEAVVERRKIDVTRRVENAAEREQRQKDQDADRIARIERDAAEAIERKAALEAKKKAELEAAENLRQEMIDANAAAAKAAALAALGDPDGAEAASPRKHFNIDHPALERAVTEAVAERKKGLEMQWTFKQRELDKKKEEQMRQVASMVAELVSSAQGQGFTFPDVVALPAFDFMSSYGIHLMRNLPPARPDEFEAARSPRNNKAGSPRRTPRVGLSDDDDDYRVAGRGGPMMTRATQYMDHEVPEVEDMRTELELRAIKNIDRLVQPSIMLRRAIQAIREAIGRHAPDEALRSDLHKILRLELQSTLYPRSRDRITAPPKDLDFQREATTMTLLTDDDYKDVAEKIEVERAAILKTKEEASAAVAQAEALQARAAKKGVKIPKGKPVVSVPGTASSSKPATAASAVASVKTPPGPQALSHRQSVAAQLTAARKSTVGLAAAVTGTGDDVFTQFLAPPKILGGSKTGNALTPNQAAQLAASARNAQLVEEMHMAEAIGDDGENTVSTSFPATPSGVQSRGDLVTPSVTSGGQSLLGTQQAEELRKARGRRKGPRRKGGSPSPPPSSQSRTQEILDQSDRIDAELRAARARLLGTADTHLTDDSHGLSLRHAPMVTSSMQTELTGPVRIDFEKPGASAPLVDITADTAEVARAITTAFGGEVIPARLGLPSTTEPPTGTIHGHSAAAGPATLGDNAEVVRYPAASPGPEDAPELQEAHPIVIPPMTPALAAALIATGRAASPRKQQTLPPAASSLLMPDGPNPKLSIRKGKAPDTAAIALALAGGSPGSPSEPPLHPHGDAVAANNVSGEQKAHDGSSSPPHVDPTPPPEAFGGFSASAALEAMEHPPPAQQAQVPVGLGVISSTNAAASLASRITQRDESGDMPPIAVTEVETDGQEKVVRRISAADAPAVGTVGATRITTTARTVQPGGIVGMTTAGTGMTPRPVMHSSTAALLGVPDMAGSATAHPQDTAAAGTGTDAPPTVSLGVGDGVFLTTFDSNTTPRSPPPAPLQRSVAVSPRTPRPANDAASSAEIASLRAQLADAQQALVDMYDHQLAVSLASPAPLPAQEAPAPIGDSAAVAPSSPTQTNTTAPEVPPLSPESNSTTPQPQPQPQPQQLSNPPSKSDGSQPRSARSAPLITEGLATGLTRSGQEMTGQLVHVPGMADPIIIPVAAAPSVMSTQSATPRRGAASATTATPRLMSPAATAVSPRTNVPNTPGRGLLSPGRAPRKEVWDCAVQTDATLLKLALAKALSDASQPHYAASQQVANVVATQLGSPELPSYIRDEEEVGAAMGDMIRSAPPAVSDTDAAATANHALAFALDGAGSRSTSPPAVPGLRLASTPGDGGSPTGLFAKPKGSPLVGDRSRSSNHSPDRDPAAVTGESGDEFLFRGQQPAHLLAIPPGTPPAPISQAEALRILEHGGGIVSTALSGATSPRRPPLGGGKNAPLQFGRPPLAGPGGRATTPVQPAVALMSNSQARSQSPGAPAQQVSDGSGDEAAALRDKDGKTVLHGAVWPPPGAVPDDRVAALLDAPPNQSIKRRRSSLDNTLSRASLPSMGASRTDALPPRRDSRRASADLTTTDPSAQVSPARSGATREATPALDSRTTPSLGDGKDDARPYLTVPTDGDLERATALSDGTHTTTGSHVRLTREGGRRRRSKAKPQVVQKQDPHVAMWTGSFSISQSEVLRSAAEAAAMEVKAQQRSGSQLSLSGVAPGSPELGSPLSHRDDVTLQQTKVVKDEDRMKKREEEVSKFLATMNERLSKIGAKAAMWESNAKILKEENSRLRMTAAMASSEARKLEVQMRAKEKALKESENEKVRRGSTQQTQAKLSEANIIIAERDLMNKKLVQLFSKYAPHDMEDLLSASTSGLVELANLVERVLLKAGTRPLRVHHAEGSESGHSYEGTQSLRDSCRSIVMQHFADDIDPDQLDNDPQASVETLSRRLNYIVAEQQLVQLGKRRWQGTGAMSAPSSRTTDTGVGTGAGSIVTSGEFGDAPEVPPQTLFTQVAQRLPYCTLDTLFAIDEVLKNEARGPGIGSTEDISGDADKPPGERKNLWDGLTEAISGRSRGSRTQAEMLFPLAAHTRAAREISSDAAKAATPSTGLSPMSTGVPGEAPPGSPHPSGLPRARPFAVAHGDSKPLATMATQTDKDIGTNLPGFMLKLKPQDSVATQTLMTSFSDADGRYVALTRNAEVQAVPLVAPKVDLVHQRERHTQTDDRRDEEMRVFRLGWPWRPQVARLFFLSRDVSVSEDVSLNWLRGVLTALKARDTGCIELITKQVEELRHSTQHAPSGTEAGTVLAYAMRVMMERGLEVLNACLGNPMKRRMREAHRTVQGGVVVSNDEVNCDDLNFVVQQTLQRADRRLAVVPDALRGNQRAINRFHHSVVETLLRQAKPRCLGSLTPQEMATMRTLVEFDTLTPAQQRRLSSLQCSAVASVLHAHLESNSFVPLAIALDIPFAPEPTGSVGGAKYNPIKYGDAPAVVAPSAAAAAVAKINVCESIFPPDVVADLYPLWQPPAKTDKAFLKRGTRRGSVPAGEAEADAIAASVATQFEGTLRSVLTNMAPATRTFLADVLAMSLEELGLRSDGLLVTATAALASGPAGRVRGEETLRQAAEEVFGPEAVFGRRVGPDAAVSATPPPAANGGKAPSSATTSLSETEVDSDATAGSATPGRHLSAAASPKNRKTALHDDEEEPAPLVTGTITPLVWRESGLAPLLSRHRRLDARRPMQGSVSFTRWLKVAHEALRRLFGGFLTPPAEVVLAVDEQAAWELNQAAPGAVQLDTLGFAVPPPSVIAAVGRGLTAPKLGHFRPPQYVLAPGNAGAEPPSGATNAFKISPKRGAHGSPPPTLGSPTMKQFAMELPASTPPVMGGAGFVPKRQPAAWGRHNRSPAMAQASRPEPAVWASASGGPRREPLLAPGVAAAAAVGSPSALAAVHTTSAAVHSPVTGLNHAPTFYSPQQMRRHGPQLLALGASYQGPQGNDAPPDRPGVPVAQTPPPTFGRAPQPGLPAGHHPTTAPSVPSKKRGSLPPLPSPDLTVESSARRDVGSGDASTGGRPPEGTKPREARLRSQDIPIPGHLDGPTPAASSDSTVGGSDFQRFVHQQRGGAVKSPPSGAPGQGRPNVLQELFQRRSQRMVRPLLPPEVSELSELRTRATDPDSRAARRWTELEVRALAQAMREAASPGLDPGAMASAPSVGPDTVAAAVLEALLQAASDPAAARADPVSATQALSPTQSRAFCEAMQALSKSQRQRLPPLAVVTTSGLDHPAGYSRVGPSPQPSLQPSLGPSVETTPIRGQQSSSQPTEPPSPAVASGDGGRLQQRRRSSLAASGLGSGTIIM